MDLISSIQKLKKERNIAILAHYYTNDDVQKVADYVGDSFYLSKLATTIKESTIVMCGVSFMAESLKLLNEDKKILIPDKTADCPMAHMVDEIKINEIRQQYKDLAVVCYINSTANIKALADVCVTSSNAKKIVEALPQKNIYFIPDEHLGRYISQKIKDKHFIFNNGYCPIHVSMTLDDLKNKKENYPNAIVVAHPECPKAILDNSDFIGSTSEIIDYVEKNKPAACIVATEIGILYQLKNKSPNTIFHTINRQQVCPDMKKITLEKLYQCMKEDQDFKLDPTIKTMALKPLKAMMELTK